MIENNIIGLLKLNNSYQNWKKMNVKTKFSHSINLLDKFSFVYDSEINKLPYRLNLLDDLSTNENAHSKFLIRLLQHQSALINFINFINNDKSSNFTFDVSTIKKPILTYEKLRIDGLIKENNKYAIIIENKIHNAVEQEHQIGRYINKCKSIGFSVEQIFVIYLTRTERDNHSEQTWGNEYSLANFNKRYSKLSYESKILPWLESYLRTLSPKEELIKSAVIQYIDHLKHFFNKKEIYSKMNAELQNFLTTELNLNTDNAESIEVVERKISEISNLKEQLEELARVTKKKLFEDWKKNLDEHFEFTEYVKFNQSKDSFIKTGVTLECEGKVFSILIEHNYKSIYFGFGRHFASEKFEPEIKDFLESIIESENLKVEEPWWYGWKYTSFNDGYLELENLIRIVKEKISALK
ncbi:PD-(D/E)XK nuclease family protein [Flavobacterium psychrophilum]|uniref:PD-(D/E)XK nuclease family protein n=2 Tax=Flavobacterium psychrophilum TaxID=96345 RepID=A0A7U2NDH5_FLAPS|nr:PD-(D/E)XK nuclease family protein [Flavobacterium psychrophilum]EKT4549086.1 PD-(D/E)XK nuclease family protein [Flavobacterium psychrophilum]ELY1978578.1 PD-(D/E)XK nuclease family protein [Flavobacterium psychrophilum]ELY2009048.1 PD-(D/E)XK nuclease family protein [Flavobacterium psychrophilum]MCB6061719.1 PD-(D/E)XK nuclease family protein [Flavobacterium psychrophilum]QRE03151.1 PD-(D/E)XK nuclease family protein [Flavobacterium psychrophilum]